MSQNVIRERPHYVPDTAGLGMSPEDVAILEQLARALGNMQRVPREVQHYPVVCARVVREACPDARQLARKPPGWWRRVVRDVRRAVRAHDDQIEADLMAGTEVNLVEGLTRTVENRDWPPVDREALAALRAALERPLRAEAPRASWMHYMLDAVEDNIGGPLDERLYSPPLFLVEHDWASLLSGSEISGPEGEGPDVRLPFDACWFEMQFSGVRVLVLCQEGRDGIMCQMLMCARQRWFRDPDSMWLRGETLTPREGTGIKPELGDMTPLRRVVGAQLRACCAVLEAGAAERREVRQAGSGLDRRRRGEGRAGLRDYFTLGVRHRSASITEDSGTRRKLHFRRGHWRRLEGERWEAWRERTSETRQWIRWMLVGDPELGWVERVHRL